MPLSRPEKVPWFSDTTCREVRSGRKARPSRMDLREKRKDIPVAARRSTGF